MKKILSYFTLFEKIYFISSVLLIVVSFFAFKRSDTDEELFNNKAELFGRMGMDIKIMDERITKVASSQIREDFKTAQKYLPEKIFLYLREKEIYGE